MSKITTHVLDTAMGRPAAGIAVRLERRVGGGWIEAADPRSSMSGNADRVEDAPAAWTELARGCTDADGRCRDLVDDAERGEYRLVFDTGAYFARMGRLSLYPEVTVAFRCSGEAHYHLPLLLSDNSYTTYRGS